MGDVIDYFIVLFIEVFKKTLEAARLSRALKSCSKSGTDGVQRSTQLKN
jgi:hypothetical protein